MVVRVVRLGTPRLENEGTRIGTVRRPPRDVPKAEFASQNWYDVWFPNLAPSIETMKLGQEAKTPAQWAAFTRKYRAVECASDRPLRGVIHCHCGQCRRLSGSAFTTWASVARKGFRLAGEENLVAFEATANVTRHFCRRCGTHVFTSDVRYPGIVGVPAGILTRPAELEPSAHYYTDDKSDWYTIADTRPQFPQAQ